MNSLPGKLALTAALLFAASACTPLVDHSASQCRVDADCDHFGGHPFCMKGVCVPSGYQPDNCFLATPSNPPTTREQFLNQCSTAHLPDPNNPGKCAAPMVASEVPLIDPPTAMAPAPSNAPPPVPTTYCKDVAPPGGSVLYMSGSSNFKPLLGKLAPYIVSALHLTPIFKVTTSCTGVRSMDPRLPGYMTDHFIRDPAAGSTDTYAQYYMGGDPVNCLLGPNGATVDVGESEIYPDTCGVAKNTVDVAEDKGPVLPIVLAVPRGSHARDISAETARQVFGGGGVAPWDDPSLLYIRGPGTATLRLIGLAIGVGPTKFWGIDQGSAEAMAKNLQSVTDQADKAIGMIGTDLYDTYRLSLKTLGFRATGQECAYLPDSSLTSRDKINVRDGHYPLWGRLHFYTALVGGLRISDAAQAFVSLFALPVVPREMLDAFIDSSFIPDCAMKLTRATEAGVPVSEPPSLSCGCYFDAFVSPNKEPPDPLACKRCVTSVDCTDVDKPLCNYGFCDALRE